MKRADPTYVKEQAQVLERKLADLQAQRSEVLLDLASDPANEAIHGSISEYDSLIARTRGRIDTLYAALSTASQRQAEAFALKLRKDAGTTNEQALQVKYVAQVEAAAEFHARLDSLLEAADRYHALGDEAQRLVYSGMRPISEGTTWRRGNLSDIARGRHSTLTMLLDVLRSREVREMDLKAYAERMAERLNIAIARTLQDIDTEAAK